MWQGYRILFQSHIVTAFSNAESFAVTAGTLSLAYLRQYGRMYICTYIYNTFCIILWLKKQIDILYLSLNALSFSHSFLK